MSHQNGNGTGHRNPTITIEIVDEAKGMIRVGILPDRPLKTLRILKGACQIVENMFDLVDQPKVSPPPVGIDLSQLRT